MKSIFKRSIIIAAVSFTGFMATSAMATPISNAIKAINGIITGSSIWVAAGKPLSKLTLQELMAQGFVTKAQVKNITINTATTNQINIRASALGGQDSCLALAAQRAKGGICLNGVYNEVDKI